MACELGSSSMTIPAGLSALLLLLLATAAAAAPTSEEMADAARGKRQLSPAVRLQADLDPLIALYGFGQGTAKRSEQMKRHIAPALNAYQELDSLNDLFNVGKRHLSISDDVSRQVQLYNKLFDAGRKRAISPAMELQDQLMLNEFLDRAGRR